MLKRRDWITAAESIHDLFGTDDNETALSRYYDALNDIATAVAEFRYAHDMTQTELAKMLGVTQAMVSKYESGDYNISLKAVYELFEKIGMSFHYLIKESDDPTLATGQYANDKIVTSSAPEDDMALDVA